MSEISPDTPAISEDIPSLRKKMAELNNDLSRDDIELLLKAVVNQSPIPMVVASSSDLAVRYANRAAVVLLGAQDDSTYETPMLEEIRQKRAWDYVNSDGIPLNLSDHPLHKAMRGITTCNEELCILRKDGSQKLVLVNANPIRKPSGKILAGLITYRDITEHRRTEEALRMNKERFKRLLQNSNDIIAIVDDTGILISIHGPLENISGYTSDELIGTNAFLLIHPDDVEHAFQVFAEALHQPGVARRVEYRYRHKNSNWIALEVVGANFLHDPVVQGVVLNIRDVSERSKLQEQLNQAMKMEAVGRLAGGVAHDFNNLLTTIAGNAQLARLGLEDSNAIAVHLDEIGKACNSAAGLTRQLLSFSRRQIIEPAAVDLNELILNLHKMMTRLLREDIVLQMELAQDLHCVRIDPGQFEQVFINLAVNARDAMPEGGSLIISTANIDLDEDYCAVRHHLQPGKHVLLTMTDTGHGLSEEAKKHLFEPFFTTKPKGIGTGLGLATIFGTVKQAGGHIEAYSDEGMGTTFKIHLPITAKAAQKAVKEKPLEDLVRGNETILIVEDEPSVRSLAAAILKRLGYQVLQASNGGDAFLLAEKYTDTIQLLMTDVVMPEMNGREVAEHLLRLHPETRVLFTSGYTEDVMIHHGVMDASLNFIGKPYNVKALARKVREVLDKGSG